MLITLLALSFGNTRLLEVDWAIWAFFSLLPDLCTVNCWQIATTHIIHTVYSSRTLFSKSLSMPPHCLLAVISSFSCSVPPHFALSTHYFSCLLSPYHQHCILWQLPSLSSFLSPLYPAILLYTLCQLPPYNHTMHFGSSALVGHLGHNEYQWEALYFNFCKADADLAPEGKRHRSGCTDPMDSRSVWPKGDVGREQRKSLTPWLVDLVHH